MPPPAAADCALDQLVVVPDCDPPELGDDEFDEPGFVEPLLEQPESTIAAVAAAATASGAAVPHRIERILPSFRSAAAGSGRRSEA